MDLDQIIAELQNLRILHGNVKVYDGAGVNLTVARGYTNEDDAGEKFVVLT